MTNYTNVPIAAAGDWVDDTYLNTYLGDNFRAVFGTLTGAGQLLASTGIATLAKVPVTGNNNFVLMEDTSLPTKMKFARSPANMVFYSASKTNVSWNGDNKTAGTYTLTLANFDGAAPSGVRGILMSVTAYAISAFGGEALNIRMQGTTGNGMVLPLDTAIGTSYASGIVGVNIANGQFEIVVSIGTANVYIDVWGYLL